MLFILIWFFVDAHKWFKGPKINIEVSLAKLPPSFLIVISPRNLIIR